MASKKNGFAQWMNDHPVAAGFAATLLYVLFRRGWYYIYHAFLLPGGVPTPVYEIVDVIWPFLMVLAFGRLSAYRGGKFFRTLLYGIVLILYGLIPLVMNISDNPDVEWQTPLMIVWGAATMFFVGFREESVFRGIVANIFADKYIKDRRGIFITVFAAAAFFGVMHMQNMVLGQSFTESVLQSVNAFFLGALIVAAYLRGGSLWALMLIHGFIDLGVSILMLWTVTYSQDVLAAYAENTNTSISLADLALYVLLWAICLGATLILLRKKKCGEIIDRFQARA